ncbi:MAG: MFS transporter [Methyloceanibacter sp.]|uniref:MFS transporter n=1 Tax=Methyloceanibacter sp. TaxID=1965321 RepID=UPI003D6CE332
MDQPRLSLAWRLGFLYAALFLVVGVYLPYLPLWLKWRHLDADQIAILLAAPLFVRILFSPAISFAADRIGGRRTILIALAWGSLVSFVLLWLGDGFWQMLFAAILLAANWTTIMPLIETVAVSGIRTSGLDYGRVRAWGSLSFIVASLGAGFVIQVAGAGAVLPLLLGATALMVVGAYLLPRDIEGRGPAAPAALRRLKLKDAFALASAPLFLLFLLAASMIQASHSLLYAFGSVHWRAQGFSGGTIGALWSIGVIAEIALFAVSGRLIAFAGTTRLMMLAGLAAVVRWGLLAIDPPLWATGLLQALHGLSFGATHLAAIHFLTHAVPEDRAATAQGLYAAVVAGIVMGSVTVACGPLYTRLGGEAYGVMALIALFGSVAAFLLHRHWRGGLVVEAFSEPLGAGAEGGKLPVSRD